MVRQELLRAPIQKILHFSFFSKAVVLNYMNFTFLQNHMPSKRLLELYVGVLERCDVNLDVGKEIFKKKFFLNTFFFDFVQKFPRF